MPPKADKLQQNIEGIKSFLNRKLIYYPELSNIFTNVSNIEKSLLEKKLTLQIVSNQEYLIQSVFDLISKNEEFSQGYKIKYDLIPDLPKETKPNYIYKLKLANSDDYIEEFELENQDTYIMGRCPDLNFVIDSNIYRGISWKHAEIKPIVHKNDEKQWQIKDLNSSNGIYVNGKKIIDSSILQSNDLITFANNQLNSNIAGYIFTEEMIINDNDQNNPYYDVINCDLLLLVVEYQANLSQDIIDFLKTLDITKMSKQFLILDVDEEKKENNLDDIINTYQSWLDTQNFDYKIDFFPVDLKPYYQEDYQEELSKAMQKRLDKFIKGLGNVVKRQPENILAKRLSFDLIPLVSPLEKILIKEDEELKQKITALHIKLQEITAKNWKDMTKKSLTEVKEEKDKFFKQIKSDLVQGKAAILDNFSKRSIICQIQNFVDELQPIIFKKEGQPYVKLGASHEDNNTDLNQIIIKFSTSNIEKWALKEWDKVLNIYGNDGLNGLLNRCYESINIIPDLFNKSPFHPPSELDIKNNFVVSFMGIESDIRHKQVSMAGYIMKSIRSNLMQIMMMATMIFALLGQKMGKNEMFGQLSKVFKQFPFLLGLAMFALIFFLTTSYNQDNNLKLEEASEKLKKEVGSYYQSFSKNLLDKVIQDLNLALEYEANRIDNSLEIIQETYNEYIMEMEKQQIQVKANLENFKEREKNLSKEIVEFKKLIRN
jgi:FHA domain